ncbi:transmembrane transport [Ascochyta rabiei]|uniref:Transmembrane transport n=1 Tax=Didymella rabiei TaxID=5454 RepID=A0A163LR91_DIDRA|nr:transmembrane transport [Ascochyta rabiei]
MTSIDHAHPRRTTSPLKAIDNVKSYMTCATRIERTETNDHDVWKQSWMSLVLEPMLWIMYLFNFLGRNALVNAKLNSLDKDLNLAGTQYNKLISILFVGDIAGQIPSNMVLSRVRPSWYLGGAFGPALAQSKLS